MWCSIKPIKNEIIFWNQNINLTKYVNLYFQEDAKFTKKANWKKEMMESFERWQKRREGMEYNEKNEISPCTSLNILEPQERCTISINIPFKRLHDHGDQRILYKEVVIVFEHYNYLYKSNLD